RDKWCEGNQSQDCTGKNDFSCRRTASRELPDQVQSDRNQQEATIGTQQDCGGGGKTGADPPAPFAQAIKSDNREVECQRSEEDFQGLRECSCNVIRQKRTKSGEKKCGLSGASGNGPASDIGDHKAGAEVHDQ